MPRVERKRREFELVAADALDQARVNGDITQGQFRQMFRAVTKRPRLRDEIRGEFAQTLTADQESLATTPEGKLDFDAIFDVLAEFFPKLAKLKKFAGLFKRIMGA